MPKTISTRSKAIVQKNGTKNKTSESGYFGEDSDVPCRTTRSMRSRLVDNEDATKAKPVKSQKAFKTRKAIKKTKRVYKSTKARARRISPEPGTSKGDKRCDNADSDSGTGQPDTQSGDEPTPPKRKYVSRNMIQPNRVALSNRSSGQIIVNSTTSNSTSGEFESADRRRNTRGNNNRIGVQAESMVDEHYAAYTQSRPAVSNQRAQDIKLEPQSPNMSGASSAMLATPRKNRSDSVTITGSLSPSQQTIEDVSRIRNTGNYIHSSKFYNAKLRLCLVRFSFFFSVLIKQFLSIVCALCVLSIFYRPYHCTGFR